MEFCRLEIFSQTESRLRLRLFEGRDKLLDEREFDAIALADLLRDSEKYYETGQGNLVALGQSLYEWLDGTAAAWIRQIRSRGAVALYISVEERMRHLPWELLLDHGNFLCVDPAQPIVPIRSVGNAFDVKKPQNRPLRVLFMAASPVDIKPALAFEQEESRILAATRKSGLELIVEESGTLEGLQERIDSLPENEIDVVHLTGHATMHRGRPVFLCESAEGRSHAVDAEEIAEIFVSSGRFPRLLFLSGCSTGQAADQGSLPSLSETLVRAGVPAVLGWSLPVGDQTATIAASELYDRLGNGVELDRAVSHIRRFLYTLDSPYWPLLRLYVGTSDAATALVTPPRQRGRAHLQRIQVHQRFLDAGGKVEVCPRERFVGRRRELQKALRVLNAVPGDEEYAEGILLHGMGGVGKSSLAARICDRLSQTHRPLVWVGAVDEVALRHVITRELATADGIKELSERQLPLGAWLQALFERYFLDRPALFVFDDFEQNLDVGDSGVIWRSHAALACLNGLLDAVHGAGAASRVLITSRYEVPLRDRTRLGVISVSSLQGSDQEKIVDSLNNLGLKKNDEIRDHVISLAAGNPRLLNRLDRALGVHTLDHSQLLLKLAQIHEEFREELILRELIGILDQPVQQLLKRLSVHRLPVPEEVVAAHFRSTGKVIDREFGVLDQPPGNDKSSLSEVFRPITTIVRRLRSMFRLRSRDGAAPDSSAEADWGLSAWHAPIALGLLEKHGTHSDRVMYYVSPIVADLIEPELTSEERAEAVFTGADQLFSIWNPNEAVERWEETAELRRLSLEARLQPALELTTIRMIDRLVFDQAGSAKRLCEEALQIVPSPRLYQRLSTIELSLGSGDQAIGCLQKALQLIPESEDDLDSERMRGDLKLTLGQLMIFQGKVDDGLALYRETARIADRYGNDELRARLNAMRQFASSLAKRGEDPEEAPAQTAPEMERYAGLHAMWDISRLAIEGRYEEARERLETEIIPKAEDSPDWSVALGGKFLLLEVLIRMGKAREAVELIELELASELEERMGDAGKVLAHQKMAEALAANGQVSEALQALTVVESLVDKTDNMPVRVKFKAEVSRLLERSGKPQQALDILQSFVLPSYERMTDFRSVAATKMRIADLLVSLGRYEEALESLLTETLPAWRHLNDKQWIAHTHSQIALVLLAQGKREEAIAMWRDQALPAWQQVNDEREVAAIWTRIAEGLQSSSDTRDEALRILREEVLPRFEQLKDGRGTAGALSRIANVLEAQGKHAEALQTRRDRALPAWQQVNDEREVAIIWTRIAEGLQSSSDTRDEALRILREEALPRFEQLKDGLWAAWTLTQIANVLEAQGKHAEALRILREEALPRFEQLKDGRWTAWTLTRIANVLEAQGKHAEALQTRRDRALPAWQQVNDEREVAIIWTRIAEGLQSSSDTRDEALRILREEALPRFEQLKDDRWTAGTLSRIANVLQAQGKREDALAMWRDRALPAWQQVNDEREVAIIWRRIAEGLQSSSDTRDEALRILREEALPRFEQLKDGRWTAGTLSRIANVLQAQGKREEALAMWRDQALPAWQQVNDEREVAIIWTRIAEGLQSSNDTRDEALRILREEALPRFEQLKDGRWTAWTLTQIANVLEAQGKHAEALQTRRDRVLPAWQQVNDEREVAIIWRRIAEGLESSSDTRDEALRILREEALPRFEQLKDGRWTAGTLSRIANVLEAQGKHAEALQTRRDRALPAWQQVNDEREVAIIWRRIAEGLQSSSDTRDEALRILREEALPRFEQLKDDRWTAGTLSRIANVLQAQGKREDALAMWRDRALPAWQQVNDEREVAIIWRRIAEGLESSSDTRDEALRILREEALPRFEQLKDGRWTAGTLSRIANVLEAQGKHAEALQTRRDRALPAWQQVNDEREVAILWTQIADGLRTIGDPNEALRILREETMPTFERLEDSRWIAGSLTRIADTLQVQGRHEERLEILRGEVLPAWQRLGDQREVAASQARIADSLQYTGDCDGALRLLREEALPVFEQLKDDRWIAGTLTRIANVRHNQGKYVEAENILRREVLPIWHQSGNMREIAATKTRIADNLQYMGSRDEALRVLREAALPAFERLNDSSWIAGVLIRIGVILRAQGKHEEAIRMFRDGALPIWRQQKNEREIAIAWARIANVFDLMGNPHEALRILREEALPTLERLKDYRWIARTKGWIANALHATDRHEEALRLLREHALPAFESIKDVRWIAVASGQIASILQAQGKPDEALQMLRAAVLPAWQDLNDEVEIAAASRLISELEISTNLNQSRVTSI